MPLTNQLNGVERMRGGACDGSVVHGVKVNVDFTVNVNFCFTLRLF